METFKAPQFVAKENMRDEVLKRNQKLEQETNLWKNIKAFAW